MKRRRSSSSSIPIVVRSTVEAVAEGREARSSSSGVQLDPEDRVHVARDRPRIESRSARFEVTWGCGHVVGERHACRRAVRRAPQVASSAMMPLTLERRCSARARTGSCRRRSRRAAREHVILRPYERRGCPRSATATVSPAAEVAGSRRTIWRGSRLATWSQRELQPVRAFWYLPPLRHVSGDDRLLETVGRPAGPGARRSRPCHRPATGGRRAPRAAGARPAWQEPLLTGTSSHRLRGTARGSGRRCRRSCS